MAPADLPLDEVTEAACLLTKLDHLQGFRLNAGRKTTGRFSLDGQEIEAALPNEGTPDPRERMLISIDGNVWNLSQWRCDGSVHGHGVADGIIVAPMPGRVTAVEVAAGDKVAKGQRLLTMEAMKMEQALVAPFDGVVAEVNAAAGAQVVEGAVLVKVEPALE